MRGYLAVIPLLCFIALADGLCGNMKPATMATNPSGSGCVVFQYRSHDHCNAFTNRLIGEAIPKDLEILSETCVVQGDSIVCFCQTCSYSETLTTLASMSQFDEFIRDVVQCFGNYENSTTWITSNDGDRNVKNIVKRKAKTSIMANVTTSSSTVSETTAPAPSPVIATLSAAPAPSPVIAMNSMSARLQAPLNSDLYALIIEEQILLYSSKKPGHLSVEDIESHQVGKDLTPSIIYGSRKQKEIFKITSLVLVIVNCCAICAIIAMFRWIVLATMICLSSIEQKNT